MRRAAQRMNCSLPISPIFVKPSRCAEAISIATLSYFTSLFGRRCTSGCTAMAAAPRRWSSRSARSRSTSPFQTMVPSKSTSMVTTCGWTSVGGGVPTGMLSFTAWVWMGMVMMSMMSSTSITSMSGVVLMSTITSGSCPPPGPRFIAMIRLPPAARRARRRLGDEADLEDPGALAGVHHPADELVAPVLVAADVDLGLGNLHRDLLELVEQLAVVDELVVPEHAAVLVDGDDDVLRLGLRRQISFLRQLHRNRADDHRNGDEEDDQQHQHHVDQRRGVDVGDEVVVGFLTYSHGHVQDALWGVWPPPSSVMCTPPPKRRTCSIATLLRRTSQL